MRSFLVGLGLLALPSCGESHPFGLDDAERMAPLPEYATAWARVRQCTKVSADLDRVSWYLVANLPTQRDGFDPRGVWASPHRVYLVRGAEYDLTLVRHEMAHDQVQQGDHAHTCFQQF